MTKQTMTSRVRLLVLLLCTAAGVARAGGAQQSGKPPHKPVHKPTAKVEEADGEKLFRAHCNRCHVAPSELSPRVARTVLMHMRERAMLSKKDEQAILNYLAPQ